MIVSNKEKREIEEEVLSLFPSFPKEEIPEAVEIMIDYWIYIIESIDE